MKFTSLQEYFYKLQNLLFVMILIPLLVLVYLVVREPESSLMFDITQYNTIVAVMITIVVAMEAIMMTVIFKKKVVQIAKKVALSEKLDGYYTITIVRFSVMAISCMLLAAGFYLTQSIIPIITFVVILALLFVAWPRPAKVCSDLKLKGDEREMVLHKLNNL